ncbi:E3 ubiquitin-protein ligase RNF146-B [Drosophila grimshawi]|uniref:E3 ubiquitin-protein ligase RNF146-B n=1 Tax=Drosophila grimshawi TaxID=7222 RepID=UPI001C93249E|nr:E3 ubiquitin-protein ligase RNF146-B [Drosophila grimshawi]
MSQQRSTSSKDSEQNASMNTIVNLDDSDDKEDDDDDLQFVGILRPATTTIDLCVLPSTSAAAAAARAATTTAKKTPSSAAAAESAKSATIETAATASTAESTATLECPICLQTCIHPARLPCGHIFCFLCVKGVAYKNRRCAMCRREIPAAFLDNPQLVNGIDDICATRATEDGYQWYYEGRNGWWQYDDRTSQDIEEAFKKGDKSCTILVAGYVYIVDLEQLIQQRQNEPTRCRRVKRDLATIPKKGVAGLRIEGNQVASDTVFTRPSNPTPNAAASLGGASPITTNFISTIAARDAAIRIASDIIGSTLAQADELTRGLAASNISSDSASDLSGELIYTNPQSSNPNQTSSSSSAAAAAVVVGSLASNSHSNSIQDLMLSATEDLLDTTQQVIETNQHSIDLFEQALNDFQALTMLNFVDSSDENDDDDDNDDDEDDEDVDVAKDLRAENAAAAAAETSEASEPHDNKQQTNSLGF